MTPLEVGHLCPGSSTSATCPTTSQRSTPSRRGASLSHAFVLASRLADLVGPVRFTWNGHDCQITAGEDPGAATDRYRWGREEEQRERQVKPKGGN